MALTGIWNNLVKLGMPVVALASLALAGQATSALLAAAVLGVVLLLLALGTLVLVLVYPGAARALTGGAERVAGQLAIRLHRTPPSGWVTAVDGFRADSLEITRRRWPHLTLAALASHVALFLLLLACIRLVDATSAG